jgi:hypothetical protein
MQTISRKIYRPKIADIEQIAQSRKTPPSLRSVPDRQAPEILLDVYEKVGAERLRALRERGGYQPVQAPHKPLEAPKWSNQG